jgi:hypothetical protein
MLMFPEPGPEEADFGRGRFGWSNPHFVELGEVGASDPIAEGATDGSQAFDRGGFDQEGIRARVKGVIHVFLAQGGGQDDDDQALKAGLGAQSFKDFKPVAHRHVQV